MAAAGLVILAALLVLQPRPRPSPAPRTPKEPLAASTALHPPHSASAIPPDAAVDRSRPQPALFNGRTFTFSAGAGHQMHETLSSLRHGETVPALVGLNHVPSRHEREALRLRGVELLAYVPDQAWIARLGRFEDAEWCANNVMVFHPLDASLRARPELLVPCDCERVPLVVHVMPDRAAADCARAWAGAGCELSVHQAGRFSYVAARVDPAALPAFVARVARDDDVLLVEGGGGARLLNDNSMRILQSGSYTGTTPVFARGIYGSNQVIAVCDTGLDIDSCYFRGFNGSMPPTNRMGGTNVDWSQRKVIAADFLYAGDDPTSVLAWDNNGHGTHVAGDACASSLSSPVGTFSLNGMAPGAKLVVQDGGFTVYDDCADLVGLGCPVTNFFPALLQAHAQGAKIHNNSWGDNENAVFFARNHYSQASRDLDAAVWSNRDFLIVCAAGNDAVDGQVLSPSNAKNGLSVAATESGAGADTIAGFSSRGWAEDGRVKPDLAAPGNGIQAASSDGNTTTSNCTTSGGGGTSFASPLVAGLAALVRDYFAQGFHPSGAPVASNVATNVSAALVKAVLIASCRAMTNEAVAPPSRAQGWGRPNLGLAFAFTDTVHRLYVKDAGPFFADTPAQPFTAYLQIRSTNAPLKIVLTWTDFPGTPGAGKQLINDLDLVVRSPGGVFHGNVLSSGASIAATWFDRTNNIEQVYLPAAATGIIEVAVWAAVIPQATQDFALVVSGDVEEIPKDRDDDGDGLPDFWELLYRGNLTAVNASSDTDGDGCNDLQECIAGTEPTNAASHFAIESVAVNASAATVSFPYVPGCRYELLGGEHPSVFQSIASFVAGVPGPGGTNVLGDTNGAMHRIQALRVTSP